MLHHGKWPHGSDWLSEAVAECYLPILHVLEQLQTDGIRARISMDFSPINLEQLADPAFADVFAAYCDEKILAAESDYAYFAKNGEKHLQPLAEMWRNFYSTTKSRFFDKYQTNVVAGFRKLSDDGILDAMTCGATHGYFPLLLRDDNIRGQINAAVATHEQHFGKKPRGIWLPECGYRPRYRWSPPIGPEKYRNQSEERAGVEELVAEAGLEYFVIDGALTRGGMTIPAYQPLSRKLHEKYLEEVGARGEAAPAYDPNRSLADIYWVGNPLSSRSVAVFSRDPLSASRVWSGELGYPGAGVYLDFHKKHHNSGLRYWRVTGARVDLGDKQSYEPGHTEWQLDWDADDFVSLVRRELAEHKSTHGSEGIIAAPFDTELFGHWWFEGPRFIEKVMRRFEASDEIRLTDCAEALDTYTRPHVTITLPEGSWGEGGHHFVWLNHEVAWMWDSIYPLEDRFLKIVHKWSEKNGHASMNGSVAATHYKDDTLQMILEQAARELLLLESSDWEFVISTQGAIEYSKERFEEHRLFLTRLLDMAESYDRSKTLNEEDTEILRTALVKDRPFDRIDLTWWLSPARRQKTQNTPELVAEGI